MKTASRLLRALPAASLLGLILLSGCESLAAVNLGPHTDEHITYMKTVSEDGTPVMVGKCAENKTVTMEYIDDAGKAHLTQQDIGGWGLVSPNAMKTKAPAKTSEGTK